MATFSILKNVSIALFITFTAAQNPTQYIPRPTPAVTTNDASTPTTHFFPTWPPSLHIPDATASALLSSLSSLQSSWYAESIHPSLRSAVYIAAGPSITCTTSLALQTTTAGAEDDNAQMSLAVSGYDWDRIVQATWFTDVGEEWQKVVTEQEVVLQNAFDGVTGSNGSVSSGSSVERKADYRGVALGLSLTLFGMLLI